MIILIVDDHAVVRAGLAQLLASTLGADCSEAENAESALAALALRRPNLVLLDLSLPGRGGLALLPELRAANHSVLVLSMNDDALFATRAFHAGAMGYVSKNVAPDELITAVRAVAAGGRYVQQSIAQKLALTPITSGTRMLKLSKRDLEVMRLLAAGHSFTEISGVLGITYKTVANTAGNIRGKLGVARTADLIRLALGLYPGGL
jgi:two-component system invasion response regulator UvrY